MILNGTQTTSIRWQESKRAIEVLDQRLLPHQIQWLSLSNCDDACFAIRAMVVRGAPLIGAVGAFGYAFALRDAAAKGLKFGSLIDNLRHARPTAVNLGWAIDRMKNRCEDHGLMTFEHAWQEAEAIVAEDIEVCRKIGEHGLPLLEEIYRKKAPEPVQVLMHCNPGWLACLDWGTATAPIYLAHQRGIPVHVWVDETRPRNQGAKLTAFELEHQGIPYDVITDNAGGHLMQRGLVDIVLVGTDRTSLDGDVANKIGTYLKALAAFDNQVPFWVGAPSSSIDPRISDAFREIPIEERGAEEVTMMSGIAEDGEIHEIQVTCKRNKARNWGFDITPSRLVTGLITERGCCPANREALVRLFPEWQKAPDN